MEEYYKEHAATKRTTTTTAKPKNNLFGNIFGGNKKPSSESGKPKTGKLGGIGNMIGNLFG